MTGWASFALVANVRGYFFPVQALFCIVIQTIAPTRLMVVDNFKYFNLAHLLHINL